MPLRCQLEPILAPTWPSLGPSEGQSDLYFTMLFEHFMFRFFIVLRSSMSPSGAQHRPYMGPKRGQKLLPRGWNLWGRVSLFRLPSSKASWDRFWTRLGPVLGPSWAHLGLILGPSWTIWGHLGPILGASLAILGTLEDILGQCWPILGASWLL